jgi:hypothetical protein
VRKWLRLDVAPLVEAEIGGDGGVGEESHHTKEEYDFLKMKLEIGKKSAE